MRELCFERQGKARIWIGERPEILSVVLSTVRQSVNARPGFEGSRRCAAIEWLQHIGGHYTYGLLGASFTPRSGAVLNIEVAVADNNGALRDGSLAGNIDTVHAGLPEEYTQGIFRGTFDAEAAQLLGAGDLHYECGAHGEIGSSERLFHRLSGIVIRLLAMEQSDVSENNILAVIQASK